MDTVTPETRSRMMAGIHGKDTHPEMTVRRFLHSRGFRYRLHCKSLAGKPDIVLPRYRLCILIHGCFWHRHTGCKLTTTPKTRQEFWLKKFRDNQRRDEESKRALRMAGWRVFVIWECGLKSRTNSLEWLPAAIRSSTVNLEWPEKS